VKPGFSEVYPKPGFFTSHPKITKSISMKITIKVLLFASLRELTGTSSLDVAVEEGSSVEELLQKELYPIYPDLASEQLRYSIAVNKKYCSKQEILQNRDEVALLPPISGG
jgi:molybdopterin synthase sulfur carrier subunit